MSRKKKSLPEIVEAGKDIKSNTMAFAEEPTTKNGFTKTTLKTSLLPLLAVALISLAVYLNSLFNGFIYDDNHQILMNPWIKDIKYLPDIFSKNVWQFITDPLLTPTSNYYRPLMYVMYMLDYYVFGLRPWGFHLTNILFHAGNAALVFLIAAQLLRENATSVVKPRSTSPRTLLSPAFIAAFFFAVHPIHTEAVSWIASLPEVSFTFFFLLSLHLYIGSTESDTIHALLYSFSLASFFLATLCKETALILPIVLVVHDYAIHKDKRAFPMHFRRYIPYFIAASVYLILRFHATGAIAPATKQYAYLSAYQYVINIFPLFFQYLEKLLLPINLNFWHTFHPITSLFTAKGAISLMIAVLFSWSAVIALKNDRVAFFSLTVFLLPLLPAFYISALGDKPFAERYLYLPSVGFVILFAMLYSRASNRMPRYSPAIISGTVLLAVLCSIQTFERNRVWASDLLLFTDTVKKSPEAEGPNEWLGFALMNNGRDDEAIEQFRKTLLINPYAVGSHRFLGDLYMRKGQHEEAISHYEKLVSMFPNDLEVRQLLADAFMESAMIERAKEEYQIIAKLNPNSVAVFVHLGNELAKKGLMNEAIVQYEKALSIDSDSLDAHYGVGNAYANSGRINKAIEHFKIAVRLQPQNDFYHESLGRAYRLKGLHSAAIEEFKKAIQIAPNEPAYRYDLDMTLELRKSQGK